MAQTGQCGVPSGARQARSEQLGWQPCPEARTNGRQNQAQHNKRVNTTPIVYSLYLTYVRGIWAKMK
jgi:hypothetical protein